MVNHALACLHRKKENNMSYFHNGCPTSNVFFLALSSAALTKPPVEMIPMMFAGEVKEITVEELTAAWDGDLLIILFDDHRGTVAVAGPDRKACDEAAAEIAALGPIAVTVPHCVRMPDGSYAEVRRTYYILPNWEAARSMQNGDPVFYVYVAEERSSSDTYPWSVCDLENEYGEMTVDVDFATRLRPRGGVLPSGGLPAFESSPRVERVIAPSHSGTHIL